MAEEAERRPTKDVRKRTYFVIRDPSATGDIVVLDDPAAVQAIADGLRLKILKLLDDPASARQLAEAVDRPVTSLYHHLDLLEKHGLVQVFDIQREGRALVRRYRRAGDRFEVTGDAADVGNLARLLDERLMRRERRIAKRITLAVSAALDPQHRSDKRLRMVIRGEVDPDRLDRLAERIREVLGEFVGEEGGVPFEFVITAAPAQTVGDPVRHDLHEDEDE